MDVGRRWSGSIPSHEEQVCDVVEGQVLNELCFGTTLIRLTGNAATSYAGHATDWHAEQAQAVAGESWHLTTA